MTGISMLRIIMATWKFAKCYWTFSFHVHLTPTRRASHMAASSASARAQTLVRGLMTPVVHGILLLCCARRVHSAPNPQTTSCYAAVAAAAALVHRPSSWSSCSFVLPSLVQLCFTACTEVLHCMQPPCRCHCYLCQQDSHPLCRSEHDSGTSQRVRTRDSQSQEPQEGSEASSEEGRESHCK